MQTNKRILCYSYLRLSREEAQGGESSSITNQRRIIANYCEQNNILILGEFVDDGWSGSNFERPGFQQMMRQLENSKVNTVITKDLSRLGRDMRESSYYAEQFFPERGIRYIAIADNFDSERENTLAPFQFAMNEVYLRDGSKKVRDVLKSKRENGLYCACPPYGYKKDPKNKNQLIPDEVTAPVVKRIFEEASQGYSTRNIATSLNDDGIIPPLKYRVLYRDNFSDVGAKRASDFWNRMTIKRILHNPVYLGHTLLGKTKKVSVKSKKKVPVNKEDWAITENTHEPLITQEVFDKAHLCMGRNTKKHSEYENVRKSIFSGIAYCAKCGRAMCSAGTVYNGEREKYWYLTCSHQRAELHDACKGVRIRYADILEVVRQDLNGLISLTEAEIGQIANDIINKETNENAVANKKNQIKKAQDRLATLDKIIQKLYIDNAEGKINDERFDSMMYEFEKETIGLKKIIEESEQINSGNAIKDNFERFFNLTQKYTYIDVLDRDTLLTFVDRIEIGEKVLPEGVKIDTHNKHPYSQEIRIFYKFIGTVQRTNENQINCKKVQNSA